MYTDVLLIDESISRVCLEAGNYQMQNIQKQ
jgi:hypothetical protein